MELRLAKNGLTPWIFIFIASTAFGRVDGADDIKLVIWPPPGEGKTIQVPMGEKKLVTCKGDVPNPDLLESIKWYWPDGQELKEHDDPSRLTLQRYPDDPSLLSLVFNSVSERDAGSYRCTATYAKTTQLEVTFNLVSYMPITFEDANLDQYATKGEEFKILCRVKSNPEPRITWYKDHKRVSNSENYAIEADGLVIKNVSESDEGVYKCWVTVYTLGDTKERFIKLQVQEKPRISQLPRDVEGVEGESVHIRCRGEGKPKPQFEWLHRGQPLYGQPRHTVDKYEGTLQIDDLKVEDQGQYACIVRNDAGYAEGIVDLFVVTKPVIEEFLNITTQVTNKEVILTCRASGNPPPDVSFHKDSQREAYIPGAQGDIRIFQEQQRVGNGVTIGTLKITDVLRWDDGLYKCIASNGRTRTERMGHLTVEFPPNFDHTPRRDAWSWGGRPANLTCLAEAIPNATLAWFYQERPVPVDHNHIVFGLQSESTLQIRPITGAEFGLYTCVATSKLGTATNSIYFKQATVPGRVQQVITQQITATSVSFKLAGPVTDGGLPVEYIVVQYKVERDTWNDPSEKNWPIEEDLITIEGLEPLRSYSFRFAAKNEVGKGDFEEKVETTTKRAVPEEPSILTESPNGFAFTPYSDRIEIKWSTPHDNGERIDKYEIAYIPVRNSSNRWDSDGTKTEIFIPPPNLSHFLSDLRENTYYRVEVRAHNALGWGNPSHIIVKTAAYQGGYPGSNSVKSAPTTANLDIPLIIIAAVVGLILIILLIDFMCCRFSNKGILYAISTSLCNKKKGGSTTGGSSKSNANGEKHPIPDLEAMDRFHNPSDLEDLPSHHAVSQPLITDTKSSGNGNGTSAIPANTFV